MEQKQKITIVLVIPAIIILCLGIYIINNRKKAQPVPQQQTQATQSTENSQTADEQNKPQTFTTTNISGTVSAITKESIEITKDGVKNSLPLTKNIPVILISKGKTEKETIADIKLGEEVSITINNANSSIVSIQKGSNAKNVF